MKKQSLTVKDRALGDFSKALEKYYNSWGNLIARSFVGGLFTALGATVGLALVLYLIGFTLEKLGVLPVVGDFFARISEVMNHTLLK
ncbi:hypothetical protein A3K24_01240 [candidate division Kazan bacterium RIFCSPHIGHO2_01_FULL_44_14]|uniref:Uncharacterized protein n=1 Tax=candidate division Kazan bacterium RIFCSPLOWO2_01_FULL_45_19 TaxID=1798538 RepID=A0A1F4NQA7_UNCK3|nr:hypothetical protein [uncultured bacterium]OGB73468.1 MAG: hypothetical protein A3K51_01240 [candidate division Kazan bacterium RIFCSPLOWO2_01_FULL_45_19]OGB77713.1 MAG: hypothetical protein A3K24_01240 [candidate division Kazan bacterium RIFCSPHIGHO2_01_FULL_44_14]